MTKLSPEQLAFEVEDILRSMPGKRDFVANPDECLPWLGRASAAMASWNSTKAIFKFEPLIEFLSSPGGADPGPAIRSVLVLLHQAKNELRLQSPGSLSIGIDAGQVFEYFDELRRVVETAKIDLLFVDPYLDAEFVSRYLPHASAGTAIRLLARERLSTLLPATAAFAAQSGARIEVKADPAFHDRFVFVDSLACYQSGASFKDGAKKSPTTITQVTDAFEVVRDTYERIWQSAKSVSDQS